MENSGKGFETKTLTFRICGGEIEVELLERNRKTNLIERVWTPIDVGTARASAVLSGNRAFFDAINESAGALEAEIESDEDFVLLENWRKTKAEMGENEDEILETDRAGSRETESRGNLGEPRR